MGASVHLAEASGKCLFAATLAAGIFVYIDLGNFGSLTANAFEFLQFDGKSGSFSDKNSFKGQFGDPEGWLTFDLDSTSWNMDAPGMAYSYDPQPFNSLWVMADPAQAEWNQLSAERLADTRATVGMWDDRLRWTFRQAVSSYITIPNTNPAYLTRSFDNAATSQRLDTTIWKRGSTHLSLFGENDRVGAYFVSPNFAIKPQDPFSTPNSRTTLLGGALQQGPVTLTLKQRAQQSLAQDNAPIRTENQVGISLSLDDLWNGNSWSWTLPSSAYVIVGQGRVKALDQSINGVTMSDVSAGFLWSRNNVSAYLGYWSSQYQSQSYPWQGLGIDGSIGYHEGSWGIDFYFDVYRSGTSYLTATQPVANVQSLTSQRSDTISGGLACRKRF